MAFLIPSDMLTSLRQYLDEPTAGFWSDEELIGRLSDASKRTARVISGQDSTFFIATTNITFVADQALYDLPQNARLGSRWDHAAKLDTNGEVQNFIFDMDLKDRVWGEQLTVGNNYFLYSIAYQGKQMRVSPTPSEALTNAINLVYVPLFSSLHEGTVSGISSTTITFPTTPTVAGPGAPSIFDDDYIGMDVVITAGTGIGQRREITDYVGGSTLQATVAAWDTTPDTSSTYAVVSPVPDDFHDVVVLDAAMAAGAKSPRRKLQSLSAVLQDRQSEMINWVDQRQVFRQQSVRADYSSGAY
jgi:hypothetical protein